MPGPDNEIPEYEIAATADGSRSHLRASHADREELIGTLKTAFVQGRLTEDELDARVDLAYASQTYAELADVTADIPAELTGAKSPRDPWRATKIASRIEYAIFLPGIVAFLLAPGRPHATAAQMVTLTSVACLLFWLLGVFMLVASRPARGSAGQLPSPAAPGAAACAGGGERLHVSHAVAREQVNRILTAAWEQGRLTEDERDARTAQVSASRCHADLAALIADLPAGLATRPPTTRDVRTGVGLIIVAAGVLAAVLLTNPGSGLAFMVFLFAAATLIVAPVMTAGLIFDVRHQKRHGGQRRLVRRERSDHPGGQCPEQLVRWIVVGIDLRHHQPAELLPAGELVQPGRDLVQGEPGEVREVGQREQPGVQHVHVEVHQVGVAAAV